jgi:excisionase family DNA binding protein
LENNQVEEEKMTQANKPFENYEKLLKAIEVAEILNISRALSYRLLQQGEIPVVKIGSAVRVRPIDLERFIQKCRSDDYQNTSK